jgi:hypothetical protein
MTILRNDDRNDGHVNTMALVQPYFPESESSPLTKKITELTMAPKKGA